LPWLLFLRLAGRRVVFDCHEDVPGTMLDKGYLPRPVRRVLHGLVKLAERVVPLLVDEVIVAERELLNHPGLRRAVWVPNWPVRAEVRDEARSAPVSTDPARLVYVGGMSEQRGILDVLDAVDVLVARGRHCELILAGPTSMGVRAALEARKDQPYLVYSPWATRPQIAGYLDGALVGLVPLWDRPNYRHAEATKTYEYWSAGVAVVATALPASADLVRAADGGWLAQPEDAASLAAAIDQAIQDPEEARRRGEQGRRFLLEGATWEVAFSRVLDVYRRLGV
jgi:glycosyltransferase involved in cell wall biosynthesis